MTAHDNQRDLIRFERLKHRRQAVKDADRHLPPSTVA